MSWLDEAGALPNPPKHYPVDWKGNVLEAGKTYHVQFKNGNQTPKIIRIQDDLGYSRIELNATTKYAYHGKKQGLGPFFSWTPDLWVFSRASDEEIKWMDLCEAAGKYVPIQIITSAYKSPPLLKKFQNIPEEWVDVVQQLEYNDVSPEDVLDRFSPPTIQAADPPERPGRVKRVFTKLFGDKKND